MDKEAAMRALEEKPAKVTELMVVEKKPAKPSYKVMKSKPTGAKELKTVSRALDSIHKLIKDHVEVLMRTDEKEGQISERLLDLKIAVENGAYDQDELEDILKDLDARIFEEKVFTEKCGRGTIRMTDVTKISVIGKALAEATKIAATKQKMCSNDYTPTSVVVDKGNDTIALMQKTLNECLPRQQAEAKMAGVMEKLVEIWDIGE